MLLEVIYAFWARKITLKRKGEPGTSGAGICRLKRSLNQRSLPGASSQLGHLPAVTAEMFVLDSVSWTNSGSPVEAPGGCWGAHQN